MDSPKFAAFIEVLETQQRTPECLSDEAIAALASSHASRELRTGKVTWDLTALASSHVSRAHLRTCLLCLQAYASLRGLMEVSGSPDSSESDAQTVKTGPIGWLTSVVSVVRRFLSMPVPLGWSGVVTASIALLVFFLVHEPPQRGMMFPTEPSPPSSLEEVGSAQPTQAEQEQREQKTVEKLSRQPVRVAREAEQRQAAEPQRRHAEQEHVRSARTAPAEIERRVAEKLQQAGLGPKMVDEVSPDGIVTLHQWTSRALTWQQDDLNRLVLQVPGVTGVRWKRSAEPPSEIARPSGETGKSGRSESVQSP